MSSIVTIFDPSTSQSTQFTVPQGAANGALVFFNESNISVDLTFANGDTMYLPAWYHRHKCGATGSVNIVWDVHQTLSSGSPPISEIIVEAFKSGEAFPADGPLIRQANVGNQLPLSSSTQAVVNDGNTAGAVIVEATVSGDTGSAVKITNDAQTTFGNATHAGSLTAYGTSILANNTEFPAGTPGNETHLVNIAGSDIVFQSPLATEIGRITNAGTLEVLAVQPKTSANLSLNADNAHAILLNNGGAGILYIEGTGPVLQSGSFQFLTGSISRISKFGPLAVTTVSTAFAHGLGAVPDIVLIQVSGGVSTARSCQVDYTSLTSTNMTLTATGSFNVYGIAIKF